MFYRLHILQKLQFLQIAESVVCANGCEQSKMEIRISFKPVSNLVIVLLSIIPEFDSGDIKGRNPRLRFFSGITPVFIVQCLFSEQYNQE